MQYLYIPALVTASGMLASAAPLTKEAPVQGLQPIAPAATRTGGPLVVAWQPDTSGSEAWKKMDISLVSFGKDGKEKVHKLASGIDGTNAEKHVYTTDAPGKVNASNQYAIRFSHGRSKKESPKFVIENGDSSYSTTKPLHARHASSSDSYPTDAAGLYSGGDTAAQAEPWSASEDTSQPFSFGIPVVNIGTSGDSSGQDDSGNTPLCVVNIGGVHSDSGAGGAPTLSIGALNQGGESSGENAPQGKSAEDALSSLGGASESQSGGASRASHSRGAARSSHAGGASRASHSRGAARSSHAGSASRGSHLGSTSQSSPAGGASRSTQSSGTASSSSSPHSLSGRHSDDSSVPYDDKDAMAISQALNIMNGMNIAGSSGPADNDPGTFGDLVGKHPDGSGDAPVGNQRVYPAMNKNYAGDQHAAKKNGTQHSAPAHEKAHAHASASGAQQQHKSASHKSTSAGSSAPAAKQHERRNDPESGRPSFLQGAFHRIAAAASSAMPSNGTSAGSSNATTHREGSSRSAAASAPTSAPSGGAQGGAGLGGPATSQNAESTDDGALSASQDAANATGASQATDASQASGAANATDSVTSSRSKHHGSATAAVNETQRHGNGTRSGDTAVPTMEPSRKTNPLFGLHGAAGNESTLGASHNGTSSGASGEGATHAATGSAAHNATGSATGSAAHNATGASTGSAAHKATGAATDSAAHNATGAATGSAAHNATGAATGSAAHNATGAAAGSAAHNATGASTGSAAHKATHAAKGSAAHNATHAATGSAAHNATRAATGSAAHNATRASTGSAAHKATGAATGSAEHEAADAATGSANDSATGSATSTRSRHHAHETPSSHTRGEGASVSNSSGAAAPTGGVRGGQGGDSNIEESIVASLLGETGLSPSQISAYYSSIGGRSRSAHHGVMSESLHLERGQHSVSMSY
ncbi:hypothetical protein MSPP1_002725 [Malassezia sp. CBS 17886]|nr:hypothetical protein MSPP1_002725 [Malassezia sp. CBS 17886]